MNPTKKLPLFIITGTSGVGKSTICAELFKKEQVYIVMEGDLLWHQVYNTPEDDFREYRELWLNVCKHISQIGLPVVLCGCAVPEQFENCFERRGFTNLYYLAVVCDEDVLESRMRTGRKINDEGWIKSSVHFNGWLKANADKTSPTIRLLDTTGMSVVEAAEDVHEWIMECLAGEIES